MIKFAIFVFFWEKSDSIYASKLALKEIQDLEGWKNSTDRSNKFPLFSV